MKKIVIIGSSFLPVFAFAQGFGTQLDTTQGTVGGIMATFFQILNFLIPILITLGVVFFIWSVVNYVIAKEEDQKKLSKDRMIYSIIGLFVITAVWGLVKVLNNTLGISQGETYQSPCIYDNPSVPGPC